MPTYEQGVLGGCRGTVYSIVGRGVRHGGRKIEKEKKDRAVPTYESIVQYTIKGQGVHGKVYLICCGKLWFVVLIDKKDTIW